MITFLFHQVRSIEITVIIINKQLTLVLCLIKLTDNQITKHSVCLHQFCSSLSVQSEVL